MKRIVIGCDHAAPYLKNVVKAHLESRGFTVIDVGTHTTDSVDYPIYAHAACKKIQDGEADLGILICGTGVGMSLVANKHKGLSLSAAAFLLISWSEPVPTAIIPSLSLSNSFKTFTSLIVASLKLS